MTSTELQLVTALIVALSLTVIFLTQKVISISVIGKLLGQGFKLGPFRSPLRVKGNKVTKIANKSPNLMRCFQCLRN